MPANPVQALVGAGAPFSAETIAGNTALHLAAGSSNPAVAKLLGGGMTQTDLLVKNVSG